MRLLIALITCCFLSVAVTAQDYAYGQPSDLKGLKKVYVSTGADTKNRDSIIGDIEKAKLGLEIVDEIEDAEIVLSFGADEVSRKLVAGTVGSTVVVREKTQRTGDGRVIVRNVRGKNRLVLSFSDVQNSKWERKPVTNFAREFIKAYKKGNQ